MRAKQMETHHTGALEHFIISEFIHDINRKLLSLQRWLVSGGSMKLAEKDLFGCDDWTRKCSSSKRRTIAMINMQGTQQRQTHERANPSGDTISLEMIRLALEPSVFERELRG
jgi:hypothetical protein